MARRPFKVAYGDILGMPYRAGALDWSEGALDCAGAALEVVARSLGPEAVKSLRRALMAPGGDMPDEWRPVPGGVDGCEVGDLVLSRPTHTKLHLSAIVRSGPMPMALSSAERLGVFVTRARSIVGIEGVYRWAGSAD